jgi:hypothetical protein
MRVFTASEVRKAINHSPELTHECLDLELPEQVVVRRVGWPLETETVRRTLARSALAGRFDFSRMPIMLPADFMTAVPHPLLEATAVTSSPDRLRLLAILRCRERTACSSFLAEIVLDSALSGVVARWSKPASETLGAIFLKQTMTHPIVSSSSPVLVQPGRLALLTIEGDGFKITQPVLPLKRARLGELVRVSDPRSHRSWMAQVAGSGQLRTPGMALHEVTR